LSQELQQAAAQIDAPLLASRVYIGGGTPNLLSQNQLIQLTDIVEQSCVIQEQAERIIEVNPYKATYAQLALLRGLGYTQIQIELHELLGLSQRGVERSCSFQLLADVFANAREVGFTKIGIDISYGNRACNKEDFASALDDLLTLCPDRVVCHAAPAVNGIDSACDPVMSHGQKLALFVEMLQCFERFGYEWVGVSAFTRPDDEWVAAQREGRLYRNWLGYTTTRDEAVLGFGLGAVSELPGLIVQNHQDLRSWSEAIESGKPPVEKGIIVSALAEQERELLGYLSSTAQTATVGDTELEMVTSLVSKGIVVASDGHIRLTAFGRAFLNQSNDWDEALSS
jgi:oxygen-independent coproporphyrinogen-3 oxidase